MISADSEWSDVYAYAQALLDAHEEARALVDKARGRLRIASAIAGNLSARSWDEVDGWMWSRPVRDYAAAVRAVALRLCLGNHRAHVVHELVGRDGYELKRPAERRVKLPPSPAVASKIGADLTGDISWGEGATANRQARYRYIHSKRDRAGDPFTEAVPFRVQLDGPVV